MIPNSPARFWRKAPLTDHPFFNGLLELPEIVARLAEIRQRIEELIAKESGSESPANEA